MLYEIKLATTKENDKGENAEVKEHYIVDAETHGHAEEIGYALYPDRSVDVFAVFRSDIVEIINDKAEDVPFFKGTVIDTASDENGKEKETKYYILVCAPNITDATTIANEYLKQGYDMRLDALRRVKIADYIAKAN